LPEVSATFGWRPGACPPTLLGAPRSWSLGTIARALRSIQPAKCWVRH